MTKNPILRVKFVPFGKTRGPRRKGERERRIPVPEKCGYKRHF